jgi:hypothetical protein
MVLQSAQNRCCGLPRLYDKTPHYLHNRYASDYFPANLELPSLTCAFVALFGTGGIAKSNKNIESRETSPPAGRARAVFGSEVDSEDRGHFSVAAHRCREESHATERVC